MANKPQKKQQNQQPSNKSESSLVRFSKIPVVEFSIFVGLSVYQKVKNFGPLTVGPLSLRLPLDRIEKLALSTFDGFKPVVSKFENQINYADSMGNLVLDKMETTVPFVFKFQPKNTYADYVNRLQSYRRYVTDKVNLVLNFNLRKTLSGGLKLVDNYVDEYLPGSEEENQENKVGDESTLVGQVWGIGGKLKKRTLKRVQNIQRLVF